MRADKEHATRICNMIKFAEEQAHTQTPAGILAQAPFDLLLVAPMARTLKTVRKERKAKQKEFRKSKKAKKGCSYKKFLKQDFGFYHQTNSVERTRLRFRNQKQNKNKPNDAPFVCSRAAALRFFLCSIESSSREKIESSEHLSREKI